MLKFYQSVGTVQMMDWNSHIDEGFFQLLQSCLRIYKCIKVDFHSPLYCKFHVCWIPTALMPSLEYQYLVEWLTIVLYDLFFSHTFITLFEKKFGWLRQQGNCISLTLTATKLAFSCNIWTSYVGIGSYHSAWTLLSKWNTQNSGTGNQRIGRNRPVKVNNCYN